MLARTNTVVSRDSLRSRRLEQQCGIVSVEIWIARMEPVSLNRGEVVAYRRNVCNAANRSTNGMHLILS